MKRFRLASIIAAVIAVLMFAGYMILQTFGSEGHAPKISMETEEVEISVTDGDDAILNGVTATDREDGDVTSSLIVESKSNLTGKKKKRQRVTIVAFDSDNHATKVVRVVKYSDYYSPTFTLSQPLRFQVGTPIDLLSVVGAEDVLDGDISRRVKISDRYTIDPEKTGIYPIEFTVSNSSGDVSKFVTEVRIYDPSSDAGRPQIVLGQGLVNIAVGEEYNPWKAVKQITVDGRKYVRNGAGVLFSKQPVTNPEDRTKIWSDDVTINSKVNNRTPGVYPVTFSIKAQSGITGKATLLVAVHA